MLVLLQQITLYIHLKIKVFSKDVLYYMFPGLLNQQNSVHPFLREPAKNGPFNNIFVCLTADGFTQMPDNFNHQLQHRQQIMG